MKKKSPTPARFSLPPMPSEKMTKKEIIQLYQNVTSLVSRAALAGTLGQTFGGNRDIYDVLGWKKTLVFQDYLDLYERHGLAARIVDALSDESWRCPPVLMDGTVRADNENPNELTPFLTAWNNQVEDLDLWSVFNEVDTALGISRYAVILMGAPGNLNAPLTKAGKLSYLQVYDEGQATITEFDKDANSLRYGMPVMYSITFEDGGMSKPVHYTRVIHCKEGRGRSRVYGVPRLKKPYNYLSDLEKVVGSSSEAFWLLIRKGMILSAQEGQNFPSVGTAEYTTMQEEIQEWEHQLRRVMRLKGVDVTDLDAQVIDGRAQHDLLVADTAGSVGMPQRVFIGSEAGHLASTQDDSNWASVVEARIKQECAKWVKNYYNRQLELGTLPPATSKITMDFPKLFKMTELEQAEVTKTKVDAINGITGNNPETYIDIADFIHQEFPNYKVAENPPPEAPPEDNEDNRDEEKGSAAGVGEGLSGEQTQQLIQAYLHRYDPNQPRDPKGSGTGGQWKSTGGGDVTTTEANPGEFAEGNVNDLISGIDKLEPDLKGFVSAYTPKQYAEMGAKIYMSRDKKSGFAIKPDGELISVFSTAKGRGMLIGAATIKAGAKHLDCLDENNLVQFYEYFDFVETKRVPWDDQYAPVNWNYERFDNPDVVFMERK